MGRPPRVLAVLVLVAVASVGTTAFADVAFLADQLRGAGDARVRTQAALALGASEEADALQPLCDALDDPSETVRGAAAAGLGKLARKEGLECLKRHQNEPNASVKSVIARSIKSL